MVSNTEDTVVQSAAAMPNRVPVVEAAPSEVQADQPTAARIIGLIGLMALVIGVLGLIVNHASATPRLVGPTLSWFFLLLGVSGLLFHAASDYDVQVRRVYGIFGYFALLFGVIVSLVPHPGEHLLPWGVLALAVGLLFVLAFGRLEDNAILRRVNLYVLTGLGAVAVLFALIGGLIQPESFLINPGLVLFVLGLAFLWSAIGQARATELFGFTIALTVGILGGLMFLYGLVRAFGPMMLHWFSIGQGTSSFPLDAGFSLMLVGAIYGLVGLGLVSDNRLVVLTRRELSAIFYSPIAYLVLIGMVAVGWLSHLFLVERFIQLAARGAGITEPMVQNSLDIVTAVAVIFVVPVITMRLFSEEKRTGTLDVLMSVPLTEWSVVWSKFLAALIFFMIVWVPWGLYLVAIRAAGPAEGFDYRPLLAFFVVLLVTGANFVSMGLFFSSLTRNQIGAAVLTFMGMMVLLVMLWAKDFPVGTEWQAVFKHLSFIDTWFETLAGRLWLRDILLHLSMTAFWLTLTTKILEARKWL